MGQSKGGGYLQKTTVTPEQQTFLSQLMSQIGPNLQAASEGYKQFLPGGQGAQAITNQAQEQFRQQTIPSILNAFGSNAKSSSALNQALAAGASNLNSNIAAQLAQMQMSAASGLGGLGLGQGQLGITPLFAYLQKQPNRLQGAIQGGIQGAAAGSAAGPWGTAIGGGIGALGGAL